MIKEIIMKNVASYKEETKLDTENKRINLIYGLNGTGKSTMSDFLYKQYTDERFKDCKINGFNEITERILVYNKTFIEDNFYETNDLKGIFTLSKENKDSVEKIKKANEEKKELEEQKKIQDENKKEKEDEFEQDKTKKQDTLWKNIINKYEHGEFEYCLKGVKGTKKDFFNYIINIPKSNTTKQLAELKEALTLLRENEVEIKELEPIAFDNAVNIENNVIFGKIIVGNTDSSFGEFIKLLGNSDWVKKGISFLNKDNKCPFCQQDIPQEIVENLRRVFDEQYDTDIRILEDLLNKYNSDGSKVNEENIKIYEDNIFIKKQSDKFKLLIRDLQDIIENNKRKIEDKIRTPNSKIELTKTNVFLEKINIFINEINIEIRNYNAQIQNKKETEEQIKKEFWNIVRNDNDSIIQDYINIKNEFDIKIKTINNKIEEIKKEIKIKDDIISKESNNTSNIEETIKYINSSLVSDFGITSFTIVKKEGTDNLYQLKRENEDCKFKTLSEGEKMVISFLYFCKLCEGKSVREEKNKDKIIVIDDPISSLSHNWVFNIAYLITKQFIKNENSNQIFVMTHNLYFLNEILKLNQNQDKWKIYRLTKNDINVSKINIMDKDIKNEYQSLWDFIKKDNGRTPVLLANCMRHIIEYFFGFIEKENFANVFQKDSLKDTKYIPFKRYMHRESHSDMINIYDCKDFDYDNFKEAFKLVFEESGYKEHYKKMME